MSEADLHVLSVLDMRNQKALRPMRSCEAGGRFWDGSVEGPKCSETLLSNMRSEAARSLGVQPTARNASLVQNSLRGRPRARMHRVARNNATRACHWRWFVASLAERTNACASLAERLAERTNACCVCGRVARRANQRVLRLRHRLKREREQSIVEDVRREIAAITERRAKTSAQATPGAMGLPEKAANARSRRARASCKWRGRHAGATHARATHKLPPACGPQERHGRHIPLHVPVSWGCRQQQCAFWPSRSPQALWQPISGQRMDASWQSRWCTSARFCDGKVSSNVMTGQVNHGSVCGSRFYVKTGKVSDATRKHMHTCPRCQAAVWSACASGRIRVQHNTPAGRPCTQRSWKSEEKKEA